MNEEARHTDELDHVNLFLGSLLASLRRSVWDCRVDELLKPIRSTFDGTTEVVEVEARTRRGKDLRCRVTSSPLTRDDGSVAGAVLVIEELEDLTRSCPAAPATAARPPG